MINATLTFLPMLPWMTIHMLVEQETPQNILASIAQYSAIIVALVALAGSLLSRKLKSPADELARADFAYKKISDRLEEVNKDRTYLQSVVDTLREQLTKMDADAGLSLADKRKLRALVDEGDERIKQLIDENELLQQRLGAIGEKVRLGLPITLADVYGIDPDTHTPTIEEIELTIPARETKDKSTAWRQGDKHE